MKTLSRFFSRLFAALVPARSRKRKRTVTYLMCLALLALPLAAQESTPIQDNSFLIEEAYNQEPGVVQHIQTLSRATHGDDWACTFTQEWPAPSLKHQLSYTLPLSQLDGSRGAGDIALNYRYQLVGDGESRVAFSPRLSIILPTGSERRGLGSGAVGWQVMMPVSAVLSPSIVTHWNLGATVTPGNDSHAIVAGQSVVWLVRSRFNVLVENLWTRTSTHGENQSQFTISPGIRWSYDFPSHLQIVPGLAFPVSTPHGTRSLFLYLSFEHPFGQTH